jgi:hypothetical protein
MDGCDETYLALAGTTSVLPFPNITRPTQEGHDFRRGLLHISVIRFNPRKYVAKS